MHHKITPTILQTKATEELEEQVKQELESVKASQENTPDMKDLLDESTSRLYRGSSSSDDSENIK